MFNICNVKIKFNLKLQIMTEKEKYVLEHYEISKDGKIYSGNRRL